MFFVWRGAGACAYAFTRAVTPVVSNINPAVGAGNMVITLFGSNLPASPYVTLHPLHDPQGPPFRCVANTFISLPSTPTRVDCGLPVVSLCRR